MTVREQIDSRNRSAKIPYIEFLSVIESKVIIFNMLQDIKAGRRKYEQEIRNYNKQPNRLKKNGTSINKKI